VAKTTDCGNAADPTAAVPTAGVGIVDGDAVAADDDAGAAGDVAYMKFLLVVVDDGNMICGSYLFPSLASLPAVAALSVVAKVPDHCRYDCVGLRFSLPMICLLGDDGRLVLLVVRFRPTDRPDSWC